MLLSLESGRGRLTEAIRTVAPIAAMAAMGLVVFAWLCDAVGDRDGITVVDRPVAMWVAAHRSLAEGQLALLLARATSPAVLVALVAVSAAVLWVRRHRFGAVVLSVAVGLAYAVGGLTKLAEHRPRPAAPINLVPEAEASFPSGHVLVVATIALVALALAWSHLTRGGQVAGTLVAVLATTVISVDRLVVGAHWLTDVVASVALAVVFGAAALAAVRMRRA